MRSLTEIQRITDHKGAACNTFLTYVRTKALFQERLRRCAQGGYIHIPTKEIESRFFVFPEHDRKTELRKLINAGKLEAKVETINDRKTYFYKCLEPGFIDVSLVESQIESHYKPLHYAMREMLKGVSLVPGSPSTDYFDAFLRNKDLFLNVFFRVDTFAGRVHTPVTNFHRTHRPNILLDGCKTTSFDVTQMQPLLLGKILSLKIGPNEYSEAISEGKDIYQVIARKANLESRDAGKKRFFEIVFAPANDDLVKLFGDADWIRWINEFKQKDLPQNPHGKQKRYSNGTKPKAYFARSWIRSLPGTN
ncbi:MAG: hypothetical protein LC658_09070 [Bacteroidales bacterium]|nr:hypothetical protein [Bacteroidales bacterium]